MAPLGYAVGFQRALWTFLHQRVYCPTQRRVVHPTVCCVQRTACNAAHDMLHDHSIPQHVPEECFSDGAELPRGTATQRPGF